MARTYDAAWLERIAVRHLQRFPCSEKRLCFVLNRRIRRLELDRGEIDAAQAQVLRASFEAVVLKMRRFGLVDDVAYARSLVESLHRRGKGRRAISAKLRERMVPSEVGEIAIETLYEQLTEPELLAAIRYARRRRLGPWARTPPDQDGRRRALASLGRQGFGYGVAARVIDAPDSDTLEALLDPM